MTDTWLPFCVRRDGPANKQGYPVVPHRSVGAIEGEIDHSMEGYRAGAYAVLTGARQASWHFSVYREGPPEQHYPLEAIAWHAGLAGDRRADTSLIGNLTLIGKEHEGTSELLTSNQVYWSARITTAVRALCPQFRSNPLTLRRNLFEHRWLSATSCPSGRIPWPILMASIRAQEDTRLEEGMEFTAENLREIDDRIKGMMDIRTFGFGSGGGLEGSLTLLEAIRAMEAALLEHDRSPHGGANYTDSEAVAAVRDKLG